MREKAETPNLEHIAESLNNLAQIYKRQWRVAESIPLLVEADAQRRDDDLSLFARSLSPFDQAVARAPTVVEVFVGGEEAVESLAKLLAREKPGRGMVKLKVPDGASEIEVQLPGRWAVTTETRQAIKAIPGVVHVEMV